MKRTSTPAMELGWFTLCMKSADIQRTLDFYGRLDFRVVGGNPEHGYAVLNNGRTHLTPMTFLPGPLLNFRGGDIVALAGELQRRGLRVFHAEGTNPTDEQARRPGPRRYDPASWPASMHTGPDGAPLPIEGAGDFLIADPDGHLLYFDSVPVERARYRAGERFCSPGVTGEVAPGALDPGHLVVQLRVRDLAASREFYGRLGLAVQHEAPALGYLEMGNDLPIPFTVGLSAGAPEDLLRFTCADVRRLVEVATGRGLRFETAPARQEDGAWAALLRDPDGSGLLFRPPA
jgi:catechol 2,3-dioxygenase-like lactoylglutathione lyase family enzyme